MTAMDDPAADAKRRAGKNPAPKSPTGSELASDADLLTITIQARGAATSVGLFAC